VKDNVHILFLPKWYPHSNDVASGTFIKKHGQAITSHSKAKITVLHCRNVDGLVEHKLNHYDGNNMYEYIDIRQPSGNKMTNVLQNKSAAESLLKEVIAEHGVPDICHIHVVGRLALIAMQLHRKYNVPYVITEHWTGYTAESGTAINPLKKSFYKRVFQQAEAVTTVSEHLGQSLIDQQFVKDYHVIHNVVDTDSFIPRQKFSSDKTHMVHVSNLSSGHKQFDQILKAIALLTKKNDALHFHIVGDGAEGKAQRQLATELGITNQHITFYGFQKPEDVATIISKCHFAFLFSHHENQPVVLIEALSCGLPVVSSKVGGISDFINTDNGLLVARDDFAGFTRAMEEMIDTNGAYNRDHIRDNAIEKFSAAVVAKNYLSLYTDVLASVKGNVVNDQER